MKSDVIRVEASNCYVYLTSPVVTPTSFAFCLINSVLRLKLCFICH